MAANEKPNELTLNRVYDAPVEAVWDAWTDPKKVAKWWGPRGFTLTTHGKDLRPGGHWRYTMHGPDGKDWPNHTVYHEVEKHRKLVYDHGGYDDRPPLFRVTVLFSEKKGKTHMQMTMAFESAEQAQQSRKFIRQAGGDSTWDRLGEYLGKETAGRELFVINRAFEAPLETVFSMWADPKHLARWLPPTGMEMKILEGEIREGGSAFYEMSGGGIRMHGRIRYREIRRPDRLVYTQQFTDERGGPSRHPALDAWPPTMLTVVTLTAESPERTRVTVTWEPEGEVSREELEAFIRMRGSMTQGWTGSFDKLEELLGAR